MFKFFYLFIIIFYTNLVYAETSIVKSISPTVRSGDELNVVNKLTQEEIEEYFSKEEHYNNIPFNHNLILNIDIKDLRWVYKGNHNLLVSLDGKVLEKNKNEQVLDLIIHCPITETISNKVETKNTISSNPMSSKLIYEGRIFSELSNIDLPIMRKLEISNPLAEFQLTMKLICENIELISVIRDNHRLRDKFMEQELNESWNKIKM